MKNVRGVEGFTLLEMLVVLVIIGLLAGLVGPRLLSRVDTSKVTAAETQIKMIKGALETMQLDIGRLPSTEEGLAVLVSGPRDQAVRARWRGPYLDGSVPTDPWGNPYQYRAGEAGRAMSLFSLGADGRPGGNGNDKDIGYLPNEAR